MTIDMSQVQEVSPLSPPRRFTFGPSDKFLQISQQLQNKRHSLPGKLLRTPQQPHTDSSCTKKDITHMEVPACTKSKKVRKRSDSANITGSVKLAEFTETYQHGSAGVLHTIQNKAKKLLEKLKPDLDRECEMLQTIVTIDKVRQADIDHARQIIETFLQHGHVTATADPRECGNMLSAAVSDITYTDSCVPQVHTEPDSTQLGFSEAVKSEEPCNRSYVLAISYAETVNHLSSCQLFSEFTNSPSYQLTEVTHELPDFN